VSPWALAGWGRLAAAARTRARREVTPGLRID
jgi:hypothetical protein